MPECKIKELKKKDKTNQIKKSNQVMRKVGN